MLTPRIYPPRAPEAPGPAVPPADRALSPAACTAARCGSPAT